nr:uncharacterized protein LOC567059 isoform X2 [Danio rerio]|eukprot:XP_021333963.1 uncharacterized protein LOC567059 isoform X2 [Danio rerio]
MRMCYLCHVFLVLKTNNRLLLTRESAPSWKIQWRSSFSTRAVSSLVTQRKSHWSQQHLERFLREFMGSGHYLHSLASGKYQYASSRTQTQNVMKLLRGRAGCLADLGSGDGRLNFFRRF